jgi:GDP-L-fucose synthase
MKEVLVTGGHGFVGKSVCKELKKRGISYDAPTHAEADLTDQQTVKELVKSCRRVIHCAGFVGGILENKNRPGDFFFQNAYQSINTLHYSYKGGNCKKYVGLAAGCGYPKHLDAPFTEDQFWDGFPDENSYAYSLAKKNLVVQGMAYKEQYGFNSTILLPANLYGPNDNFDLTSSHVVPALIRKFIEAEDRNDKEVTVWGSGTSSREFIYVEDTAKAIVDAAFNDAGVGPYNLGTGVETTITELADTLKSLTGFKGNIVWDTSKPDGQLRRYYDMSNFEKEFGYTPNTTLEEGLRKTIEWYKNNE